MLDEMKKIYEDSASIIPGWRYKNRSDLCRSYLRVKDNDKYWACNLQYVYFNNTVQNGIIIDDFTYFQSKCFCRFQYNKAEKAIPAKFCKI